MKKTKTGLQMEMLAEGTLSADGSEQTVIETTGLGRIAGFIDLTVLASGETVIITEYVLLGGWKPYQEENYTGPNKILYILSREGPGFKVTLRQTSGTMRNFQYYFTKEV